jgi:hypothetical protein
MNNDEAFKSYLKRQVAGIDGSEVFCQLYSPRMADFLDDPAPAIQLAIAILLDKPIIIAGLPGRKIPAKLLALADAVVYGDEAEIARGIREAVKRLAP